MDADFFQNSPFRLPQWRSDRVLQLLAWPAVENLIQML
jgi:hypothetical protein